MRTWQPLSRASGARTSSSGRGVDHGVPAQSRRWIQAKLAVSRPGDASEQEADRVADTVMRGGAMSIAPSRGAPIQRKCHAGCECADCGRAVQRQALPGHAAAPAAPAAPAAVGLGEGHALSEPMRSFFESRLGHDFSHVRLHTEDRAAQASAALGARAFTFGHDIAFGQGQWSPSSADGQRLLAHELAHVIQQGSGRSAPAIQRAITVQNPAAVTPNIPGTTNAAAVQGWLDTLCPTGGWVVDAATGVVDSPNRADFCAARPVRGHAHFSTSGTRTSCSCICELTAPGSTDVRLHAANFVALPSGAFDVNAAGEGRTRPADPGAGRPEVNVGVSGIEFHGVTGAGDTAPLAAGAGATQTLRDPPWIILGHEMCGHARLPGAPGAGGHGMTPEGDRSAVDIENRIRREHSTVADSFGIRRGEFNDAGGARHFGTEIIVRAGDTLSGIARRLGIAQANRRTAIFRGNGAAITAADEGTLRAGERLLVEGAFLHEVISGETMTSIATMWNVPLRSVIRANPQIANPDRIFPGQRLLIPVS